MIIEETIAGLRCMACKSDRITETTQTESVSVRGSVVTYDDVFSACSACGHEFYTVEQSLDHSLRRAAAIRQADTRPSPSRILQIRTSFGLSQSEFERALGVGPKTVIRWEKGTVVPSSAAKSLLWLAENHPVVFSKLAEANGVALPPVKAARNCISLTVTPKHTATSMGKLQRLATGRGQSAFLAQPLIGELAT